MKGLAAAHAGRRPSDPNSFGGDRILRGAAMERAAVGGSLARGGPGPDITRLRDGSRAGRASRDVATERPPAFDRVRVVSYAQGQ